uniref:Unspecific monooxygenase n=1 Tax=Steinernema glaseri TaxID=37863 RepID=A0A1I7XXA4_9BILA
MDEFKIIKYGLDREFDALTIWDLAWLNENTYKLPGFRQRWDLTAEHQRIMHVHMKKIVKTRAPKNHACPHEEDCEDSVDSHNMCFLLRFILSLDEIASGHHHLDFENGGDDYIDAYLIQLQKKREKKEFLGWFDEDSLAVNLLDLWMAGTETTIQSLMWFLIFALNDLPIQEKSLMWFLIFALNDLPIQEKVRAECLGITKGNRDVELKDRPNMPYMNAVVTEVLRCTNVLNFNFIHETTCETVVGDYVIPKDVPITTQLSVLLNDETDFPNPGKFNPERYIRDKDLVKQVIAFGVGKRACVGESLARAELFLVISNFCQKYKFSPPDNTSAPPTDELSSLLFLKRTRRFNMKLERVH